MKSITTDDIFDRLQLFKQKNKELIPVQFYSRVTASQYQRLYKLVEKYIPQECRFLDWGCGNGHFSYFLLQRGYTTHAYSFEQEALIHYLLQNHDDHFKHSLVAQGDPVTLPFASESFDCASSVGVLEHVRETGGNELGSLKEIHRVLVSGGIFICYHFPNRYSYIEKVNSFIPSQHHHSFKYTKRDIRELCEQSDFELLEYGLYGFIPRNSWNKIPSIISDNRCICWFINCFDRVFGFFFPWLCQNHYFVARKK